MIYISLNIEYTIDIHTDGSIVKQHTHADEFGITWRLQ